MNSVLRGDSFDLLDAFDDESVHAIVTDPPYNLDGGFMGEEWDDLGEPKQYQKWSEEFASKALDVLKPGGHMVAFSGDETHHRLFSGVEDAGFEIRHTLVWLNGNGMPKGGRVSRWMDDDEDAEQWSGYRTELKPGAEFAVLARKPFSGSCYQNVLDHGTGALNIAATRIPIEDGGGDGNLSGGSDGKKDVFKGDKSGFSNVVRERPQGRYTPQVALDDAAARQLDKQVGELEAGAFPGKDSNTEIYGDVSEERTGERIETEAGGPSRFFYCAKAAKSEKTHGGRVENDHKTVKPLDLMEWLVRMVTTEGQVVVDPFAGSGTTCVAAERMGRRYVGIELEEEFARTARERVRHADAAELAED